MEIVTLVLFLTALLYTAIVIAEEKRAWRENARLFRLGRFHFPTPSWWKGVRQGDGKIFFTSSGWQGVFRTLPPSGQDLQESLLGKIKRRGIVFDEGSSLHHPPTIKKSVRSARIEGTATEDEDTRIYFDAFLLECLKTKERLYGESKSSVLSGSLEEPWFEESLNNCCAVPPDGKPGEKNSESFS